MITKIHHQVFADLDRQRHQCILWEQAREMVQRAVRRGWMAYPLSTRFNDDGRPVATVD